MVKEIDLQIQEVQRVPIMMDAKRPTGRHIIIKRPKVKDRETLKSKRKEVVTGRLPDGRGSRRMGEEVRGLRSTNRKLQNSHGGVKYSVRKEQPKNLYS